MIISHLSSVIFDFFNIFFNFHLRRQVSWSFPPIQAYTDRKRFFWKEFAMKLTSFVQERRLTVLLQGEIDHHRARELMSAISEKIDLYLPLTCILDFEEVRFMDSSGIAVVLHALRRMNSLQGKLLLQNIPPQPYKVLRAAGIEKVTSMKEECPQ
jgi:stage II sporulation protein AA (anti-sigma F factor antagonist)